MGRGRVKRGDGQYVVNPEGTAEGRAGRPAYVCYRVTPQGHERLRIMARRRGMTCTRLLASLLSAEWTRDEEVCHA